MKKQFELLADHLFTLILLIIGKENGEHISISNIL